MSNSYLPQVKILIVDDRSENLLTLQAIFKNCGYQIYEALSGKAALEHARHHDFACILLDVQMPILDGFETARALRSLPKAELTPIIFITAIHRSEQYEELGYTAGAVDYLFKPINTKILLAKVTVFVDMFLQSEEIKRKNILLEEAILRSKENEELKLALKIRDEFLMMVGHELKTPITPLYLQMQAFIELYESDTADKVTKEKLIRMLKTSRNQVERLSRLINELVDVSKISTKRLEINKKEMSMTNLAHKVLNDFEAEIKKSNCVVYFQSDVDTTGVWDNFRIEQVLVNLLNNSLKYGSEKPIYIEIKKQDCQVTFSMRDFGIGIKSEDQKRIFERFERAVSSHSYSGLGLGLFISKEIVALHSGKIWVESQPNNGSTFYISLPTNAG